jgi:polysaccharide deacetylase family protein (PEP-CTERM system associated)
LRRETRKPLDLKEIVPLDEARLAPSILTVDVEEWYHVNYLTADRSRIDTSVSRVYDNTMNILEALAGTGSRATFFILGCVAREFPSLITAIDRAGHEAACHGDMHELIYTQTPPKFKQSLKKAVEAISSQTGKKVIGFRAPSCSITEKNPWALDVLCEEGFLYDSSIFPIKNYMYGVRNFPVHPCRITTASGGQLLEIPPPALEFGRIRVPFGGGIYLRLLPLPFLKSLISIAHARRHSFMLYFHPSDTDTTHMKIELSLTESFFHNVGRRNARKKILDLLKNYQWTDMRDGLSPYL